MALRKRFTVPFYHRLVTMTSASQGDLSLSRGVIKETWLLSQLLLSSWVNTGCFNGNSHKPQVLLTHSHFSLIIRHVDVQQSNLTHTPSTLLRKKVYSEFSLLLFLVVSSVQIRGRTSVPVSPGEGDGISLPVVLNEGGVASASL